MQKYKFHNNMPKVYEKHPVYNFLSNVLLEKNRKYLLDAERTSPLQTDSDPHF